MIKTAETNSDLIEIEADFFHVHFVIVRYPATAGKPAFRLRILQCYSQKSGILLAHLQIWYIRRHIIITYM